MEQFKDVNRRKSKHKEKLNIAMFGQKRIPSREGGVEIVVEELCSRMVAQGHNVTCYNRGGHHVSGSEYDSKRLKEYKGIRLKTVPTIEKKGLAAVSSSFFAALCCAFGRYDIVHIHAEGPAFFAWLPKLFGKKVIVTIHGLDWQREKWKSCTNLEQSDSLKGERILDFNEHALMKNRPFRAPYHNASLNALIAMSLKEQPEFRNFSMYLQSSRVRCF